MKHFRIHGDNIVECERTLALIERAFSSTATGPTGSIVCPSYSLETNVGVFSFTFFPGYERWDASIVDYVRQRGGVLRETADALITKLDNSCETPLIAIEYCGALPAGNQAWQRSGRAFSFAHANIPFIYVAELGGYELDSQRGRKAARLPNPAVPFSYLLLHERSHTICLPVFVPSPSASLEARRVYTPFYGEEELTRLIRNLLVGEPVEQLTACLKQKGLALIMMLASNRRRRDSLLPAAWQNAYNTATLHDSLVVYLAKEARMPWSKTAYIEGLTNTAERLMRSAALHGVGLTSSSLPMCIIPTDERGAFAEEVKHIYGTLPDELIKWLNKRENLVVCWVMGFKPRGDDARPDRGLPPLARMLAGDGVDLLTVVYGPAKTETWPTLQSNPVLLQERNGLWESILGVSDAILIDSSTYSARYPRGYVRSHWAKRSNGRQSTPLLVTPRPRVYGEQDVDTVLHTHITRMAGKQVFEGLCNPPGGDWSGISLLTEDKQVELRWTGMPRETASDEKRPDHIFQIFDAKEGSVLLVVESKETARSIEPNIGPRLKKYISSLIVTPPTVERAIPNGSWHHSKRTGLGVSPRFATCAAYIVESKGRAGSNLASAGVDILIGVTFSSTSNAVEMNIHPLTASGKDVSNFLHRIPTGGISLSKFLV